VAKQVEIGFLRFWRMLARYCRAQRLPQPTLGEAVRSWHALETLGHWREDYPRLVEYWRDPMTKLPAPDPKDNPGTFSFGCTPGRYRKD
jgi:hypothetical protein